MGVIMLTTTTSATTEDEEDDDLCEVLSPSLMPTGELAAPEAFVWTPPAVTEAKSDDDKKQE